METSLFHTHAIVNNHKVVRTLIDSGAQSYASIQEKVARKANLKILQISLRQARG